MNTWEQSLLTLVTGLIISIFTSYITVKFALRQFYSQKWWEKKWDHYEKIIGALYHIRHIDDRLIHVVEHGKDLSPERIDALKAKSKEGSDELERSASIGAFVISKEAILSLRNLRSEFDLAYQNYTPDKYYEYLNRHLTAVDKCISEIIQIARKDLKLN